AVVGANDGRRGYAHRVAQLVDERAVGQLLLGQVGAIGVPTAARYAPGHRFPDPIAARDHMGAAGGRAVVLEYLVGEYEAQGVAAPAPRGAGLRAGGSGRADRYVAVLALLVPALAQHGFDAGEHAVARLAKLPHGRAGRGGGAPDVQRRAVVLGSPAD